MKKLATMLAVSTVLGFGATARAADIVEAPTVYDWTGFYIGGNISYAFEGQGDDVGISSNVGDDWPIEKVNFGSLNISGITGGAQIGADWQAGSGGFRIVAGVQGGR